MLRLILMRHAKSDWGAGLEDHDRPLNKRGSAASTALGRWLRTQGHLPDQVLCSSAERTQQTLTGLELGEETSVDFSPELYLAGAEKMLGILRTADARVVLMIGHNPGIADLAARLVKTPATHARFHDYPTGATLVVEFDVEGWGDVDWHSGQSTDFTVPRDVA